MKINGLEIHKVIVTTSYLGTAYIKGVSIIEKEWMKPQPMYTNLGRFYESTNEVIINEYDHDIHEIVENKKEAIELVKKIYKIEG